MNQEFFVGSIFDKAHPSGQLFKSPGTTNTLLDPFRVRLDLVGVDVNAIATEHSLIGPGQTGVGQ